MNFCVNSGSWIHSCPKGRFELAAESGHPLRYVGLKTNPALLAVIGDIDTRPALFLHDMSDALLDHVVELRLIDRLAGLVGDQQIVELGAPRQAAGVRGHYMVDALMHEFLLFDF